MTEQLVYIDGELYHADDFSDEELAHYGVKGMKWGVRKSRPAGVSRSTNRRAAKDAKEFTQAKMFYGEGAGNRRKLIKATVAQRSKDMPGYKEAFDMHVSNTDMSKRASQAKRQRAARTTRKTTAKHTRGALNVLNGNPMAAAGTTVAVVGAGKFIYDNGGKEAVAKGAKAVKNAYNMQQIKRDLNRVLKNG